MRRLTTIFLVLLMMLGTSQFVSAAINSPDSGPYLDRVDVYRHVLEDDDMLVRARYQIPYDNIPEEAVSQAYLGRFREGSTEFARVTPYSYYNSGYGYGSFSMYLDAASAPGWEGNYTVELTGSPTLEWLTITATSAIFGAVADDGGSQTDETSEANSATANDMTLLPATPALNDAYYFCNSEVFSLLTLNIGTQGGGVWTITWEYWDGDGWEALPTYTDYTDDFMATVGNHDVSFTPPSNWATTTVLSITGYWIRARVSAYTSVTTQPLGTQCWINSAGTAPIASTTTINWRATAGNTATQLLLYAHIISWAEELSDYWNIALTTSTAAGTKLSSYGQTYFTNVIPELRTMCPKLFSAAITTPQYVDTDWRKSQSEATKAAWPFDWGGISEFFALPSDDEVFRTIVGFIIAFTLCAVTIRVTNRTDFAIMSGYALLFVLAVPGFISPIIVAGFTFTSVVVTGLVFILGKA